jgi:hypothetical protein
MRGFAGLAVVTLGWLSMAGPAAAQSDNTIAVPPAPPIMAAPPNVQYPSPPPAAPPPPGLVQTPLPPPNSDTGADNTSGNSVDTSSPAAPAAGSPAVAAAPPANDWVPGKTAIIGVLDKVDGSIANVSIPVGGQSTVGDMQVSVLACVVRPPAEVPDAAIFLATTAADNLSGPPLYRGWIVQSVPGAAVAGNASDTFRVIGCS